MGDEQEFACLDPPFLLPAPLSLAATAGADWVVIAGDREPSELGVHSQGSPFHPDTSPAPRNQVLAPVVAWNSHCPPCLPPELDLTRSSTWSSVLHTWGFLPSFGKNAKTLRLSWVREPQPQPCMCKRGVEERPSAPVLLTCPWRNKLNHKKFHFKVRKDLLTFKVAEHWKSFPGRLWILPLETLKTPLGVSLCCCSR